MLYETIDLNNATLTVYARTRNPENAPKIRPAILIMPGGGYNMVSFREGEPVALRFLAAGYAVFVLAYTVRAAFPVPFNEASAAMKYIRDNADKYDVDPNHVCAAGFSAGGHLAGLLATAHAEGCPEVQPNAVLFGYPVVTTEEGLTHEETSAIISGGDPILRARLSIEKRVTEASSPAFIWHTMEDNAVPVENSLMLAASYKRHAVPFEMHIFEKGWHGLSTADLEVSNGAYPSGIAETVPQWVDLALRWLKTRGFEVKEVTSSLFG